MSAPANAAISYDDDSFVPGDKPMGRRTAGLGMLRGFVEHAGVDTFVGYSDRNSAPTEFEAAVRRFGGRAPVQWATTYDTGPVQQAGALHVAGPLGPNHAFRRRWDRQRGWSLTGVTHTVSSHTAADAFAAMGVAPVQSWDALICTSRAVKAVVQDAFAEQADYLEARMGGPVTPVPLQLPIIPLGVRCPDFAASPLARAAMRRRLGVPDDAVLVLHAARLSFHSKAHPYPMYLALQQAAERTGVKVHLLLASWFADAFQEGVFRNGAAELCPDVVLHVLDGREPGVWEGVWQAGDIYTLMSDNIQESYGLSPVEAMAAGMPVVGSDWNGLKDTIVHGETGYLAPTLAPPGGAGFFAARAYMQRQITYDQYIAATAQVVSVDVGAAADAFTVLIADGDLRKRMGEAARRRALSEYDWSRVIPRYQALWTELAARRAVDAELAPRRHDRSGDPARSDPYFSFAAYPTRQLTGADQVSRRPDFETRVRALAARAATTPVPGVVIEGAELEKLLDWTSRTPGELTVDAMVDAVPSSPRWRMVRTIAWLSKHDMIAIEPPAAA